MDRVSRLPTIQNKNRRQRECIRVASSTRKDRRTLQDTLFAAQQSFPFAVACFPSNALSSRPDEGGDSELRHPKFVFTGVVDHQTVGGAAPLPTARTVAHWFGSTFNPLDGVTYGHNMVGADANNCSDCDVTITVDITPLIVTVDGLSFDGSAALPATLASPIFATYDFGSVPFATAGSLSPRFPIGPGGPLSQNDAGNLLQRKTSEKGE
jgi:hypothetical protein